jgi:hypothetical protein
MLNLYVINQICFNKLESNFVCRTRHLEFNVMSNSMLCQTRIRSHEHHFGLIRNGYTVAIVATQYYVELIRNIVLNSNVIFIFIFSLELETSNTIYVELENLKHD